MHRYQDLPAAAQHNAQEYVAGLFDTIPSYIDAVQLSDRMLFTHSGNPIRFSYTFNRDILQILIGDVRALLRPTIERYIILKLQESFISHSCSFDISEDDTVYNLIIDNVPNVLAHIAMPYVPDTYIRALTQDLLERNWYRHSDLEIVEPFNFTNQLTLYVAASLYNLLNDKRIKAIMPYLVIDSQGNIQQDPRMREVPPKRIRKNV